MQKRVHAHACAYKYKPGTYYSSRIKRIAIYLQIYQIYLKIYWIYSLFFFIIMEIIVRKTFAMAVILRVVVRITGVVYAVTYVTIVSVQVTSTWLQQLTAYANYLLVRYSSIDESLRNERIVRCSS